MKENETITEFHIRLKDIVNSLYNLDEVIPEYHVVKKILRSLPECFIHKITVIEESKDLNTLKENELLGSFQIFEADVLLKSSSQKKDHNISFKAQQSHNSDVEDDDDDDLDLNDDEIALLAKNLGKFLRLNKKFNNRPCKPNENNNKRGLSNQRGIQGSKQQYRNNGSKKDECYECHGKGYYAWECATKINKLRNANHDNHSMNVTLSDDEDNSQSHEEHQYTAFVASHGQQSILSDSKEEQNIDFNLFHESEDASDDEHEEELDLQIAYDQLCEEMVKTNKRNIKLNTKLIFF